MRFLLTLFWTFVALVLLLFAGRNWHDVTLALWGAIELDIKLPILILLAFLIGMVPTWLRMRGKLWRARHRIAQLERPIQNPPAAIAPEEQVAEDL